MKVLYISYDGLTDPLGRSQVLPYLLGLSARGHQITVLSCEKAEPFARDRMAVDQLCTDAQIAWQPLKYHKRPPVLSTVFDLLRLRHRAQALYRSSRFDLVHCRSYIPAEVGLNLKRRFGVPLLFDMRGFWPEERLQGGSWNLANPIFRGIYRYFKGLETKLLKEADHIISLTHRGKEQLLTRPELQNRQGDISVVPCCVDFTHFPLANTASRRRARTHLGIADGAHVLLYLGSIGSWYMLEEMLDFFRVYLNRKNDACFLFVTTNEAGAIEAAARSRGVDPQDLVIVEGSRNEVPALMAAADLGIFFIRPVSSKVASSPTKLGEMLAVGLPVVANPGIGDVADFLDETGTGISISRFDGQSYAEALRMTDCSTVTGGQRRDLALSHFDLATGIERYHNVYRTLVEKKN